MAHLALSLFGGMATMLDGQPVAAFGTDKVRALLAYLAVESSHPHQRSALAGLLWPDSPQQKAESSLRQTIRRLRGALREDGASSGAAHQRLLLISSQDIQLNPLADCQVDVALFTALLASAARHTHAQPEACPVCIEWLAQAAALYRGDFLAGFALRDSVPFDEWQLLQQEALRGQALEVLARLAAYHEGRGEPEWAQRYAQRLVALDPWHEPGRALLMRTLAQGGQATAALQQYEVYRRTLAEELGVKPPAEITRLYEQIRAGKTVPPLEAPPGAEAAIWLPSQGERRQVTVLVCSREFQGDAEELQEQLAACERCCEGIYHRFGGRRVPRQGAECLIYFGYPQAYEDAARRAVHSALAVLAALGDKDPVCIGIHTGVLLVGERRGARWQDRDLAGPALETARRCLRLAAPGQVVITEETRRLVPESFDLQPLEAATTGEPGQPARAYRVLGESGAASRLHWLAQTQRLLPFFGREEEMRQLEACRQALLRGQGRVVLVRGEPGIGKSRLLWELRQSTPPVLWLSSRCQPRFQNTALYPMVALLEQLLGFRTEDSLDARRDKLARTLIHYGLDRAYAPWLLSLLLGLPTGVPAPQTITPAQREQMRELFLALLSARAAEQPFVLVIEDLHWSDPSTVDWLGRSFASLAAAPCLALLTARPAFHPAWLSLDDARAHVLTLGPLRAEQAAEIIRGLADESGLRDEIRRHIVAQADGVPLFIEELTKTVLERPDLPGRTATAAEVPATLLDSLVERLDRLGAAKETAQWAAAIGRDFPYPLLRACAPYEQDRVQGDLARLIEAELVSPVAATPQDVAPYLAAERDSPALASLRYAFRHALMQEAAYASMLKRTRQSHHRRIAETLESRYPQVADLRPEILAQHYAGAGMPGRAADYYLRAGKRATAQGATLEARTFFDRALEGIEPGDRERRWRALWGREAVLDLREERQAQGEDIAALMELAEALDDDTRRAQALLSQAQWAVRVKDFAVMLRATEAARAAAVRAGHRALELQALGSHVNALAYVGDWSAAHQAVEQILAKLPAVADDAVEAHVRGSVAFYYARIGDISRALHAWRQGLEATRRAGDRQRESRLASNIGFAYMQLGRYAEARAALEEGLALAEMIGDRSSQTPLRNNLSYVLWHSGERDQAQAVAEQVREEFRTNKYNAIGHACCLTYLGIFRAEARDWAAAAAHLAQARALYDGLGVTYYRMEAQAVEARCMLALGRWEKARQGAAEVWAYLRAHGTSGMDFPSRVYVAVADVLGAIETPGLSARTVIEAGYRDLLERAERISDAEWRRSFLENAAENRTLVERWSSMSRGAEAGAS